ncbi:MAG: ABC transporter substrate-binding protein [Clostridiales bacterium]|nr:ABC transporter substrate-binding protein [Clostridiales bacterium]
MRLRLWVWLLAGFLVLSACGTGSPIPGESAQTPSPGEPRYGGTLVRSLNYGDPANLDPIVKNEVAAQMVTMNLFDTLVHVDPVEKTIQPGLAESWDISPDGLTYTFHLRQGAKFHNGRDIKAQDVVYSFQRVVDPKNASPFANRLEGVVGYAAFRQGEASRLEGLDAPDDYTVVLHLEKPKPGLFYDLGNPALGIVPREEVERLGEDFGQRPVGSGPFQFESWQKDDQIVLAAFPDYWAGRPYLDRVIFRIMKEEATRDAEFQAGNLDVMVIGEAQYKRYSQDPNWKPYMIEVPELFTRALHLNTTRPPLDNVKVRQAINYAVDKALVIEKVLSNKAYVAVGPIPSSSPAFNPNLKGYEYNPDKARQLLKEAGLEHGFDLEVISSSYWAKSVEGIMGYLQDVGIRVKLVQMESTTVFDRTAEGDFQAAFNSYGGGLDAVMTMYRIFHSSNFGRPGNTTRYHNPQVDALLEEALYEMDEARRIQLVQEAEKIVVEEAPWFFFNYNKAVMIHQPWVHGLRPVPTDIDYQDLTKVWVDKR